MDQSFHIALEAFTGKKKKAVLFLVEKAVQNSGAWITDFTSLEEKLIHLGIECEADKIQLLFNELQNAGIRFYDFAREQISELSVRKIKSEINISLSIHFAGGEPGDLGTTVDDP